MAAKQDRLTEEAITDWRNNSSISNRKVTINQPHAFNSEKRMYTTQHGLLKAKLFLIIFKEITLT